MKQIIVGAVLAVALFNTPVYSAEQKFHSLNTLTPDELYALTPRELAKSLIKMEIHDIMDLTRLEMVYIDRATAEKRYNSGLLKYLHPARVLDADMRNLPSLQKKLSDLRRYYPAYSDYGTLEKIKKRMKGGAWASKQEFIKFRIRLVKDFHGQSVKNFDKYTKSGGKEGYDSYKNARKDLSLIDLIKAEEAEEELQELTDQEISEMLLAEQEQRDYLKNQVVYNELGLNEIYARGIQGQGVNVGVIGVGMTNEWGKAIRFFPRSAGGWEIFDAPANLIPEEFGNRITMEHLTMDHSLVRISWRTDDNAETMAEVLRFISQRFAEANDYSAIRIASVIGANREGEQGGIHGIAPESNIHVFALPDIIKVKSLTDFPFTPFFQFTSLLYEIKNFIKDNPKDVVALAPESFEIQKIAEFLNKMHDTVIVTGVEKPAYRYLVNSGKKPASFVGSYQKMLIALPLYKGAYDGKIKNASASYTSSSSAIPFSLFVIVGQSQYRLFKWKSGILFDPQSYGLLASMPSEAPAEEAAIGILTGAAALVREAYPDLKASQVVQLLMQTGRDIGRQTKLLDLPAAFKPVGARKVLKLESLGTSVQELGEIAKLRVLQRRPDLLLLSPSFGDAIRPGVLTIKVFDDFPSIYRYFTQDLSAGFTTRQAGPSALLNLMGSLDTIEGGKSYVGGLAFSLFKPKRAFATTATRTQERTKLSDMGMQLAYTLGDMEYRLGLGLGASRLPHSISGHAPSFVRTHAQGQYLNEVLSLSVRPLVVAGGSVRFGVVRGKGKTLGFSAQDKVGGGTRAYTSYMKAFGSAIAYAEVGYIKEETGVMGSFGRGILAMAGSSSTYGSLHIVVRSRSLEAYAYGYISSTRVQEAVGSYLSEFSVAWSRSFAVGLKRALGKRSALMGGVYMPLRSSMEARVWDFETSDSTLNLYKRAVTLAPSGVERVGYLGYTRRLSRGGELEFLGALRFDAGHIKGRTDHLMMLRFSKAF